MKVSGLVFVLFSMTNGIAANAFAWGEIGHAATGEIAERALTPRARNLVYRIIGSEPLSVAANWPDEVRSSKKYDPFKSYHFAVVSPAGSYADTPHPDRDMNSIVIKAVKMLAKRSVPREEKMLYLRYLVHIVGDIHQPLHTSIPGTYGGNACFVKVTHPVTGNTGYENFHHFWDETLIEFERRDYRKRQLERAEKEEKEGKRKALSKEEKMLRDPPWFGYNEYANELAADPAAEAIRAEVERAGPVREGDYVSWITESGKIGETAFPVVPEKIPGKRPYCGYSGGAKPEDNPKADIASIPTLDDAYAAKWLPTVRTQILRGGYRLAKILDGIAGEARIKALDPADEKAMLERVLGK